MWNVLSKWELFSIDFDQIEAHPITFYTKFIINNIEISVNTTIIM